MKGISLSRPQDISLKVPVQFFHKDDFGSYITHEGRSVGCFFYGVSTLFTAI